MQGLWCKFLCTSRHTHSLQPHTLTDKESLILTESQQQKKVTQEKREREREGEREHQLAVHIVYGNGCVHDRLFYVTQTHKIKEALQTLPSVH